MRGVWNEYDPRIPWIFWAYTQDGGFLVHDQRTGQTQQCPNEECVHQFAADHSSSGRGLGDMIHRATKALGFKRCGECAKRQVTANVWTPWR
jgi:hypothetical protein